MILLMFFCLMAFKGDKIHELVCVSVKKEKMQNMTVENERYLCLPKECVCNGKVYEIYKQKDFFGENIRVREVDVEVSDIFLEEGLVVIESGIEEGVMAYYAVIPEKGLEDGEAVVVQMD